MLLNIYFLAKVRRFVRVCNRSLRALSEHARLGASGLEVLWFILPRKPESFQEHLFPAKMEPPAAAAAPSPPSQPTKECKKRLRRDIGELYKNPLPGVCVCVDDADFTVVHALVTGPFGTPYEGGFFLFEMRCPPDYPHRPPAVKLLTTGGGRVRFNPNLYACGKVCLSILGTWAGPGWTPCHSISSVLLSIQSLMNAKPYHNEPGFEVARNPRDVEDYNDVIRHECLRAAVLDMAGDTSMNRSCPEALRELMRELLLSFAEHYDGACEREKHRDGTAFCDPFGFNKGVFRWDEMHGKVTALLAQREAELEAAGGGDDESDDDDDDDDEEAEVQHLQDEGGVGQQGEQQGAEQVVEE